MSVVRFINYNAVRQYKRSIMNYPSVGIGILNWNGRHYLEQFLHYLYKVTYPNVTIYVIDNASSDDSIAYLQQQHPSVKIIETGGNYGVAGGYNIGFAQMPETYLLMLNSDVEVDPGFLEPLVHTLERDSNVAIVQSKLLAYNNKHLFEYGGAAGGMIDIMGYSFCRGRIFNVVEEDSGQYKDADIFWAGGACCLIRKTCYQKVNGMYEKFFMHFEEVDMCWRMWSEGYRIVYCNDSIAYHVGGGTLSYQSPKKTYFNFRNNLIMCLRNAPWYYLAWWLPARFLMDTMAALMFVFKKDTANAMAVCKGYGGMLNWLFHSKNEYAKKKTSLLNIKAVAKYSVIWRFYIRKKKTYARL